MIWQRKQRQEYNQNSQNPEKFIMTNQAKEDGQAQYDTFVVVASHYYNYQDNLHYFKLSL